MEIDLNKVIFPPNTDGVCGPLPKQAQFMGLANDPKGPQCLAYFGGVGSGKSVVLCGTILTQMIVHGGEYVISRLYMPELRRTTMKCFLDMVPPELLIEHRVADAEIRIKSASGKPAVVYFVGLDEPSKLLSLNLSGAGIDEGSEVSQEAFMLLLNRLRNKSGLRKILVVGNPRGHNWVYSLFVGKKGLKNPMNYRMILAPTTENTHLPEGYVQNMLDSYSPERIKRDVYGSFDSFEGQVFSEFDREQHAVRPFKIPGNWERHIRIDHGFRNPAAFIFCAVNPEGEVYVYKEIYEREKLIKELVEMVKNNITKTDKFQTVKIDPSTRARRGTSGASDYDEYVRHWPTALPPIGLAKNDVQVGVDRVKSYLKVHPKFKKPMLYIFDTCQNLLEEISTYRYPELRPAEQGNKAEKENPLKINDHAIDALRYFIVDLPEPYNTEQRADLERQKKYTAIEIKFQDELKALRTPVRNKDPFD